VVAYPHFQELDNEENKKFVKAWRERFGDKHKYIIDSVNVVWLGWHLWAKAVEKAKTTETEAVIKALESGIEIEVPSGKVVLDPGSHHVSHSVHIGVANANRGFDIVKSLPPIAPKFEQSVCDLVKNPDTNKQFTPQ
jgi:branched-chain amino acid transport system substrate-binding protein